MARHDLVENGWDQRPAAAHWRAQYTNGWEGVLDLFGQSVTKAG